MFKKKRKKKKPVKLGVYYKGYDIHWLRDIPEHPDYHLVAEYDVLKAKEK